MEQQLLAPLNINANYRMWKYAVIISDTDNNLFVKDGDRRNNTITEAKSYAASQTIGKARGVMKEEDILGVWDMTKHAKSINKDPSVDVDASRNYDNDIRHCMPLKRKLMKNFLGQDSLELHPIPKSYIEKHGDNWRDVLKLEWDLAHKQIINGGLRPTLKIFDARPYLVESFNKTAGSELIYKFLLAAATGAGKETSTLALLIHIHDCRNYDQTTLHFVGPTIPSTCSELFNELGTVGGMNVSGYGFIDFARIKPYITKQWYNSYLKDCSPFAKLYIQNNAIIVDAVSDIPRTHDKSVVPVLFGSYHDIALKSGAKVHERYAGLVKRIGILAIGEAHQMLSNADNKMWDNLNKAFGKKCFKLFITGTPYDFIYGNAAAEFFSSGERALFTRNDLYKDKRNNINSHYKDYPDFNFYGINVRDIVEQLKMDLRWKGDENGFTFNKLFTYDPRSKKFIYEQTILWMFTRMFTPNAFNENGDPLSIFNAPELCDIAKMHGMVALPIGNKNASAKVYINALKKLLINNDVFQGDVFDAYDDDLGDRKDDIAEATGRTLTLTCNKDCTGANIPQLGYFVFMRKLGDSVKFFEQATGRVGRAFPGKTNCGIFLADLENSMNVMLTIEEKINADRDEDFSVRTMIEELLENYNFFTGRNGKWEAIDPIDFASTLEELNAKGNYGINQCLRNTDPDDGFDLFFNNTTNTENKRKDINTNGNSRAKNKNRKKDMEQLGLPFNKNKSFKQNWINAKLTFASKCRMLAFMRGAETVKDCVKLIESALEIEDKETLSIVGKGVEWFSILMTNEHIDINYTNRWIQKFNDNRKDVTILLEMLADPIHKTDTFVAEPNIILEKTAKKIVSKLKKKNNSFIDGCAGRGGYIIYMLEEAKKQNIDIDLNKVYYNDIDKNMTMFFKQVNIEYKLGIPEENITSEDFLTMEFKNMKFSAGTINPPYEGKSRKHQQFFNKMNNLIEEGGIFASLQPATTYFNKKNTHLNEPIISEMVDTIEGNTCEVEIENPEIFDNAGIQNDLSITYIIKDNKATNNINKITYKDGNEYTDVPLSNVSQTVIDPVIYESIRNKFKTYCNIHGNLEDVISKNLKDSKVGLPKIRGTRPTDNDFYTFIPKVQKDFLNYDNATSSSFGIVTAKENKDNVYDYLRSYVARFGLALLKFSQNTANKEFAMVPLVDFSIKHTDCELFNMIGLSLQEEEIIKKVICNYYAR